MRRLKESRPDETAQLFAGIRGMPWLSGHRAGTMRRELFGRKGTVLGVLSQVVGDQQPCYQRIIRSQPLKACRFKAKLGLCGGDTRFT